MLRKITLAMIFTMIMAAVAIAGVGPPHEGIWADGMLYRTVATPGDLPAKGPKDALYVFTNLEGQHPISEAKPGDRDYNGGRWQVYFVTFTEEGLAIHDADMDGVADFELMSDDAVMHHISLGHLMSDGMGPSFVCPLIK